MGDLSTYKVVYPAFPTPGGKILAARALTQSFAQGSPVSLPVVGNWSPALASAIQKEDAITFEITDILGNAAVDLKRVVVHAQFGGLKIYEVVHDGDAFGYAYPAFLGNVRTAITGGYRFTILRQEGWPGSPRIVPMAFDKNGYVNPITDTVYAFTLI